MKAALTILVVLAAVLGIGTWRDPDFWRTADQRGDALMKKKEFAKAAKAYHDPMRIGIAQYRDGAFEAAAGTFARVAGADGQYNSANAWLMHGQYEKAIGLYDRALSIRPGWKEAVENKAVAIARHDRMTISDKDREAESAEAYDPDDITFDNKGGDEQKEDQKPLEGESKDVGLQARWLRRVKTTPAQFLRAKFAWQASQAANAAGGAK
jgi:Ca-activated chloride channel family protein